MIALLCITLIIGVFWAGHFFALYGFWSMVGLGFCVLSLGLLFAAAETRGFQGQYVRTTCPPYRWISMWRDVWRALEPSGTLPNTHPLYVQTDHGTLPLTGVFTARMNGENAIVFDTTPILEEEELPYVAQI